MSIVEDAERADFTERVLADLGAAISGLMVYLGDRLGLYRAMSGAGSLTPAELAARTGTHERYVREWLDNQAAGGYVQCDAGRLTYELPDEHAPVLADEQSVDFLAGAFTGVIAACADGERFVDAFQTGRGLGWHEHDDRLALGTARMNQPEYRRALVAEWLPSLGDAERRLRAGASVADVGCGHGAPTILMARAYPLSRFAGFDTHGPSIEVARQRAKDAGVADRVRFEIASAKDYAQESYDLVTFFDCLHDLGDPVGAAVHARRALVEGGTVMLVEPNASDEADHNHNARGRLLYGYSTVVCTMVSRAQEVGLALGGQAGEGRLREIFEQAGFVTFRRVAETRLRAVYEAKV